LSSMYSSGLSMLRALDVSSGTIGNTYIAEQFSTVASKVRNGAPLSVAIAEIDGFDPKLVSTIFIGEESGRLDEMLDSIADNFDYESEQATEKMITFIEPIMIMLMAVVIGAVMLSVMVPLYTMYDTMGS
ncbi:MAG: type II secretion system F family protein, partial [Oscillospiraceae bacterium]